MAKAKKPGKRKKRKVVVKRVRRSRKVGLPAHRVLENNQFRQLDARLAGVEGRQYQLNKEIPSSREQDFYVAQKLQNGVFEKGFKDMMDRQDQQIALAEQHEENFRQQKEKLEAIEEWAQGAEARLDARESEAAAGVDSNQTEQAAVQAARRRNLFARQGDGASPVLAGGRDPPPLSPTQQRTPTGARVPGPPPTQTGSGRTAPGLRPTASGNVQFRPRQIRGRGRGGGGATPQRAALLAGATHPGSRGR